MQYTCMCTKGLVPVSCPRNMSIGVCRPCSSLSRQLLTHNDINFMPSNLSRIDSQESRNYSLSLSLVPMLELRYFTQLIKDQQTGSQILFLTNKDASLWLKSLNSISAPNLFAYRDKQIRFPRSRHCIFIIIWIHRTRCVDMTFDWLFLPAVQWLGLAPLI